MKRITMSFYVSEENEKQALDDIKSKVIEVASSSETIVIEEDEEKLGITRCDNLVVLAHPDYFIYNTRAVPDIVSFNENGYIINSSNFYSSLVRLYDKNDAESKKNMKAFMKSKSSIGYKTYSVYKLKDYDNSYYIKIKDVIDEEAFVSNPYDSFVKLYDKKYFDTLDEDNFKTVKKLFNKCCTSQANMESLLEFLLYVSKNGFYNKKLQFEPKHIEELVKILKEKGITFSAAFRALYDYTNWFNATSYERTKLDYYILQHIYGLKPKYIERIKTDIVENSGNYISRYYRSQTLDNIKNANDFELFLSYTYYLVFCTHNSYWLNRKDAPSDASKVAAYALCELVEYIEEIGCDMSYKDLKEELTGTIAKAAVCYTSIISHHTGSLINTEARVNKVVTNNSTNYAFSEKLIMETILTALELLKGRSKTTFRDSIITHIISADMRNKEYGLAKDMNDIVKQNKLTEIQNTIMKVKLSNNKKS